MNVKKNHALFAALALVVVLSAGAPRCGASLIWFDETNGGQTYDAFADLAAAYGTFTSGWDQSITFDDLSTGTKLANQYADLGVRFRHTTVGPYANLSRVQPEGGSIVQDLTGYDGSYMPNGNAVVVKFDNNVAATPFTMDFADGAGAVGAFVGMGMEGSVHSLTINVYSDANALLGTRQVQSWRWEASSSYQNNETFFGVRSDGSPIGRVEILNNATADFANALVIDNVRWRDMTAFEQAPEPATLLLIVLGLVLLLRRQAASPRPRLAVNRR